MTIETILVDGKMHYICDECSEANAVQSGGSMECRGCGTWYRMEIYKA